MAPRWRPNLLLRRAQYPADHPARDAQDTFYFPETAHFGNIAPHTPANAISCVRTPPRCKSAPCFSSPAFAHRFARPLFPPRHDRRLALGQLPPALSVSTLTAMSRCAISRRCSTTFLRRCRSRHQNAFPPALFRLHRAELRGRSQREGISRSTRSGLKSVGCAWSIPRCLRLGGYDPHVWSGYAFGMGLERLAYDALRIDICRYFYQNDLRFLKQFA